MVTLVGASLLFPEIFFSPGPLAPGHAHIKKCGACHSSFAKPRGETCVLSGCHNRASWEKKKGVFMGHMEKSGCLRCHTDHPASNEQVTFVAPHEKAGGQVCQQCHLVTGAHFPLADQDCSLCHITIGWKPARFNHAALKPEQTCSLCHKLQERHALTDIECSHCHDTLTWKPARMNHSAMIKEKICSRCHRLPPAHGITEKECSICHDSKKWKPARFDHAVMGKTESCAKCHRLPEKHFLTRAKCRLCHQANSWKGAKMDHATLAGQAACASCHMLPSRHFATDSDCIRCHGTGNWKTLTMEHRFPFQHGARRGGNKCDLCHPVSLDKYDCLSACHEHGSLGIRMEHLEEGIVDISGCARCHPTGREHEGERDRKRSGKSGRDGGDHDGKRDDD